MLTQDAELENSVTTKFATCMTTLTSSKYVLVGAGWGVKVKGVDRCWIGRALMPWPHRIYDMRGGLSQQRLAKMRTTNMKSSAPSTCRDWKGPSQAVSFSRSPRATPTSPSGPRPLEKAS